MDTNGLERVAVIGGFVPRQCGIATFTTDLTQALTEEFEETSFFAVPMNDEGARYTYPPTVRFEMNQQELLSYRRAADFLTVNSVDLVCLQHEYGIFGGPQGSYILALLRELRMPVVTTLHTVLHDPAPEQRQVMKELAQLSDRMVVMSQRGQEFLHDIYGIPEDKVDLIPHGIPDVPFIDPNFYKDHFHVEGRMVLLTFGLISRNKGIENVIMALPSVIEHHPDVVYIALGATHPHVVRQEGESYRESLIKLADDLGVRDHIIFENRFVSLEELVQYIGAADVYVTPYLNREQVVSGTLAYTVGAGKAVVSTPYWYAQELLAEDRGMLVPFAEPEAMASCIVDLFDNETERHAMRKRAYQLGREMIWPEVARKYMSSFLRAKGQRTCRFRNTFSISLAKRRQQLPEVNLNYLNQMTDSTGMLQHSMYSVPDYHHGYCTDDNARALIAAVLLENTNPELAADANRLATRYIAFLWHAFNPATGRFRNFLSYERHWLEDVGSDDSHSRALWALGTVLGRSTQEGLRGLASKLFEATLPAALNFSHTRSWAFTLVGIHEYLRSFFGDRQVQQAREILTDRLMEKYRQHSSSDWPWFENELTYANAKLPHAVLLSGRWLFRDDLIETALRSLEWLANIQCSEEGFFSPIGCNGFYRQGADRAYFDQQPIEAQAMVSACLEAYRVTNDEKWYKEAQRAFEWYLGRNHLCTPVYDITTGGCRDGLHSDRANENQGAESTLAFLLSLLEMRLSERIVQVPEVLYAAK